MPVKLEKKHFNTVRISATFCKDSKLKTIGDSTFYVSSTEIPSNIEGIESFVFRNGGNLDSVEYGDKQKILF